MNLRLLFGFGYGLYCLSNLMAGSYWLVNGFMQNQWTPFSSSVNGAGVVLAMVLIYVGANSK